MICTAAAWGFNFVATRVVLEVLTAEQTAFARSALTMVILLPFWKPFQPIPWQMMLAALAIGTLSFYLVYEAIAMTDSLTTVAVATQMMPPLSAVLALIFYREKIAAKTWAGIAVATLGAAYLSGMASTNISAMAFVLTILGVLAYSGGTIVIGKSPSVGVWRMLAWVSALSVLPLAWMAKSSGPLLSAVAGMQARHWMALMFTVILAGLLGQAVLLHLYRIYRVADVVPWTLFVPVFAGLSSVWIYGEVITAPLVIGGSVVLFGVWLQHSAVKSQSE